MSDHLPATFTDAEGRQWAIALTVAHAMALRDEHGIDILNPTNGDAFTKPLDDRRMLYNVLVIALEDKIKAAGMGALDFAKVLDSAAFDAAETAWENAVINFSRPGERAMLIEVRSKARQVEARKMETIRQQLTAETMEKLFNAKLEQAKRASDKAIEAETAKASGL